MENITIDDRCDGFGGQYQHIIFGIIYAEMNNKIYIHKPITKMAHNYENNPNFINEIEEFINIRNHYKTTNEISTIQTIDFKILYDFITCDTNLQPSNVQFNHCLNKTNAIENIKQIFWENKTNPYTSDNIINIAVHIRRPNSEDDRIEGTDTPDEYFLNTINYIRNDETIQEQKIFHIFSQNTLDITKYNAEDIILHIDEDIKTTFLSLVSADILITSRSALSYCAALLSNGKVYSQPSILFFKYNPNKNSWITEY
jgi:hypothetical protein